MLKEVFVVLEVSEEPIVLMRQRCSTCQEMIRSYRLENNGTCTVRAQSWRS